MTDDFTDLSQQLILIQSNRDNLIEQGVRATPEYAEIVTLLHADDVTERILAAVEPKVVAFTQKYLVHRAVHADFLAVPPPSRRIDSDKARANHRAKNDAPQPVEPTLWQEKLHKRLKETFPEDSVAKDNIAKDKQ